MTACLTFTGCPVDSPISGPVNVISARFTHSAPDGYIVGKTIDFDASASSGTVYDVVTYKWRFLDGTGYFVEHDPFISHVFTKSGTFYINLIASDKNGSYSTATGMVEISDN